MIYYNPLQYIHRFRFNSSDANEDNDLTTTPSFSNSDSSNSFSCFTQQSTSSSNIIQETSCLKQIKMSQFTINKATKIKMDNALAYFIATSMMPYSLVEKEGFQTFVRALNPSYKLPSRKTLTESRIPELYSETRTNVGNIIKNVDFLSLTTDCWTSTSNQPFIALTCHFINSSSGLSSACLGCVELSEDHTGDNIADILHMLLLDYEIPEWKICSMTTDHGANMIKAVKNMNISHVDCYGHSLNIAVSRILKMEEVMNVVHKVKDIYNIFAHSWKSVREMGKIQEKFGLPQKKFPSFSKTRWWSILELINTIIEQELGLTSFLRGYKNGEFKKLCLRENEIDILKNLSSVLQPIREITDNLAADSYVTGSAIIPIISSLNSKLANVVESSNINDIITEINFDEPDHLQNNNIIKKMYEIVIGVLNQRYTNNVTLMLCTAVDPRFKVDYIDDLPYIKNLLIEMCEITFKSWQQSKDDRNQIMCLNVQPEVKKKKTGLFAIFQAPPNNDYTERVNNNI